MLLLTHVEARLGTVALDRKELTRIDIVLEPGHVHTLHFRAGSAPEATEPLELKVPSNTIKLALRCRFSLPSGAEIRTTGDPRLPDVDEGVQVVDIGACGTMEGDEPPS